MGNTKKIEMDEKGSQTKNGSKVLGIQLCCREHKWQRTIHIKDGIGCSKCYGNKNNIIT